MDHMAWRPGLINTDGLNLSGGARVMIALLATTVVLSEGRMHKKKRKEKEMD